jgi:hypothetical protein
MSTRGSLHEINHPANVNQTISKDEEADQSDVRAIRWAEKLILELPSSHPGRAEWLKLYGEQEEASLLRRGRADSL